MKLLMLVTDAFGGRGGIAKFNRDLLTVLCGHPGLAEVEALPRVVSEDPGPLPAGLTYRVDAASGKSSYVRTLLKALATDGPFDGILCGHLHLLPLAALGAAWCRVPLLLVIHGIDAWQPPQSVLVRWSVARVDAFVAVSAFTKTRFLAWSGLLPESGFVIPNCINAAQFGPGSKRDDLLERYDLQGKRVIMTLGRLSSQERYKGIDEVLAVLPALTQEIPNLAYLVAGDGDDRPRLEQQAHTLGVADQVVFTGYLPEDEKVDHYRLADAFVMPGRGEGFGIVYLEALACGIPVVASTADASREAVRDGLLGQVVNPDNPDDLKAGIRRALLYTNRQVPEGLGYFSFECFRQRWYQVLEPVYGLAMPGSIEQRHP